MANNDPHHLNQTPSGNSTTSVAPLASPAPPAPRAEPVRVPPVAGSPPTYEQPVSSQVLQDDTEHPVETQPKDLIIYSHSKLFYWWPVWFVGFTMAAITYTSGEKYQIGPNRELYFMSSNAGILFFLTLSILLLMTNVKVRGLASVIVILSIALTAFVLAYYELWDRILGWFSELEIHVNLGAYFWFSCLLFIVWALAFFVFDRIEYWRIRPGQIIREFAWGAGSKSYDTENVVLEKHRDDLFRHWILGLGTGDLLILPYGAKKEELHIPNVLFVGEKIRRIQELIATDPVAGTKA